ncbi:MAG: 16S rRNA (cytidine(1402)-2'-O)-methyltransferase [Arenicellales bacterium]
MTDKSRQSAQGKSAGSLFVVATPIGNLDDFSARAIRVLSEATVIAAEDTRRTRTLLNHFGIRAQRLLSLHDHNESQRVNGLIEEMRNGSDVALVSDAGTPLISDPGYRLVRAARDQSIDVLTIPGPSAVTSALSISGLATDRFTFEGFLPSRRSARRASLESLVGETRTMVFFESAKRVADSVSDLCEIFGEQREAALCREMTKRFESILRGDLKEIARYLAAQTEGIKGEIVLVVSGSSEMTGPAIVNEALLLDLLGKALPPRQASEIAARITGGRKNDLYQRLLSLQAGKNKSST